MIANHTFKGEQADYNDLSSLEGSCCICMSRRSMQMVLDFSRAMHWTTRYFSPTGETIDPNTVDEWASQLEAEMVAGLNNCCGDDGTPTMVRVTPDGVVQVSNDGGETWTDAPALDPRITSIQFPPLAGADGGAKACQAANNLAAYMDSWVDQVADVLDAGGQAVTVIGVLAAVFLSGGSLAAFAVPLAGAVASAGGSALRAAFDSATSDALRCCALCGYGDDGLMDDDGYADFRDCVGDISGLAGVVLSGIALLMGKVGLNNIASSGTEGTTGCDDCDPCSDFPVLVPDWFYSDPPTTTLTQLTEDTWRVQGSTRSGDKAAGFKDQFDRCVKITEVISGGIAFWFNYDKDCAGADQTYGGSPVNVETSRFQWTTFTSEPDINVVIRVALV